MSESVRFAYAPDFTEDSIPWIRVRYGLDFSGGNIVETSDPWIIRKLDGNRFYARVDKEGKRLSGQHVNPPREAERDLQDAAPTQKTAKTPKKKEQSKKRVEFESKDPDTLNPSIFGDFDS